MIYYPFIGSGATCNQITTPLVYDESLSIAQQIAVIMGKINSIDEKYVDETELKTVIDELNKELTTIEKRVNARTDAELRSLLVKINDIIESLQVGALVWDVIRGRYTTSVEASRNVFNDVTVHAITVDALANLDLTVAQLAECGLNVRGLAVFSGYLVGDTFKPVGIEYTGAPPLDEKLTCKILAQGKVKDGYFTK